MRQGAPRVSVVVPAYDEGEAIRPVLQRLFEAVTLDREVLVVVDRPDDSTVGPVQDLAATSPDLRLVVNSYGPGPANAVRYGCDVARADVTVVTMADGSDDPRQVDELARLVERGVVVAAASRYMPGGQQVGGPMLKSVLSRAAGRWLHRLARVGTRDATNSFKAYSTRFVRDVGIDSRRGFEMGIEMTPKARRLRLPVAEVPTVWLDRDQGASQFRVLAWIPEYLRWWTFAFGPRLTVAEMRRRLEEAR